MTKSTDHTSSSVETATELREAIAKLVDHQLRVKSGLKAGVARRIGLSEILRPE